MQTVDPQEFIALMGPEMELVAGHAVRRQADIEPLYKAENLYASASQDEDRRARVGVLSKVDLEIQEFLLTFILERWPFVSVMAEERTGTRARFLGGHENCILLDPIDGTRNYLCGSSDFCHIVALMNRTEMAASLVYSHSRQGLYAALRDRGATVWASEAEPRRVALVPQEGKILFHHINRVPAQLLEELKSFGYEIRSSSQNATDILGMLEGEVVAFLSIFPVVYDVWAPAMIVKEAGGWLGDWRGKAPVFHGQPRVPHLLVSRSEREARNLLPSLARFATQQRFT